MRGRRRGGKRHRWKKHGRGEINLRPRRKEVGFRFLSVGGRWLEVREGPWWCFSGVGSSYSPAERLTFRNHPRFFLLSSAAGLADSFESCNPSPPTTQFPSRTPRQSFVFPPLNRSILSSSVLHNLCPPELCDSFVSLPSRGRRGCFVTSCGERKESSLLPSNVYIEVLVRNFPYLLRITSSLPTERTSSQRHRGIL